MFFGVTGTVGAIVVGFAVVGAAVVGCLVWLDVVGTADVGCFVLCGSTTSYTLTASRPPNPLLQPVDSPPAL